MGFNHGDDRIEEHRLSEDGQAVAWFLCCPSWSTSRSQSPVFQLLAQFVSFPAGHIQVEHQVLDIQTQLRQGFLNEQQDTTTTLDGIDDLLKGDFQFQPVRACSRSNQTTQFRKFIGNAAGVQIGFGIGKSLIVAHEDSSLQHLQAVTPGKMAD